MYISCGAIGHVGKLETFLFYFLTMRASQWISTPHWSASFWTVTSLLTDRRLRSWLSGAVLTPWSLTRSKLWRWSWTSYSLTGHFIRYTLLVPDWTPFCLQNCLTLWHRINKVLETYLRYFGPYWHDSITQLLHICPLHIHDANLLFHHITKVLYWIEIWWLWRPFE